MVVVLSFGTAIVVGVRSVRGRGLHVVVVWRRAGLTVGVCTERVAGVVASSVGVVCFLRLLGVVLLLGRSRVGRGIIPILTLLLGMGGILSLSLWVVIVSAWWLTSKSSSTSSSVVAALIVLCRTHT